MSTTACTLRLRWNGFDPFSRPLRDHFGLHLHTLALCRLVGDFYLSYMTHANGHYNILHSCAMEGCHSQGPGVSRRDILTIKVVACFKRWHHCCGQSVNANITLSNNPPVDLAFFKRTLRRLLRYSEVLGVDQEHRAAWKHVLENIAPCELWR